MQSLRILIITHAPLSPKYGASQMAINLAKVFQEQGHDVTLWSPLPLPPETKWWQSTQQMRSKVDAFIESQKPFDIIDIPPIFITQRVSQSALVVARSVQPDILYIAESFTNCKIKNIKDIVRIPLSNLYSLFQVSLILQGWKRAKYILCLGSLELQWMKKWFPWWRSKLIYYVNALSKEEQEALTQIRLHRRQNHSQGSIKFLWIGRWVSHKGTTQMLNFIKKRTASHPQDTFTIAGCGTEAEKDVPIELIRAGVIKIVHSFERSQLYTLLANHDVGLFTSKVEGWGLVLNEMLESGMQVYATPVGGVQDLQSFFKETLKPFPPPLQLMTNFSINSQNFEDYYKIFTWSEIAKSYINLIIIDLCKKN
ncbi:MAG: glycosyltransferase family 4 protein [Calothrix sp. C42_A2020_038]|nr:glycosyltransferase family 4 protein [Calothrix sp. C42_A2020_038]